MDHTPYIVLPYNEPPIFATCISLRRAQGIEREVSEAEEARAACAQGSSDFLLDKRSDQNFQPQAGSTRTLICHIKIQSLIGWDLV